ncbi:MAG TPA: hypothetical protein VGP72_19055 [Planctomycetota bacterium]|jgi:hypothetical protein
MTPPSGPLARSALLIHGLALLAAGVGAGFGWHFASGSIDVITAFGVALCAAGVFALWSVLLALRSIKVGEKGRLPFIVLALFLLELGAAHAPLLLAKSVVAVHMFEWVFDYATVFFVPPLALAALLALLVTCWWVARAQRRVSANPWDPQRRWRYGLRCWLLWSVLIFLLALPWPLFLFAVYHEMHRSRRQPGWERTVIEHTPCFVGESVSAWLPESNWRQWNVYEAVLRTGRISASRIKNEAIKPGGLHNFTAYQAWLKNDRAAALDYAQRFGRGQIPITALWRSADTVCGLAMGGYGSPDMIREFLDPARGPAFSPQAGMSQYEFLSSLLTAIGQQPEFLPELRQLCGSGVLSGKPRTLEPALQAYARMAPDDELERVWPEYLASADQALAIEAVDAIRYMRNPATRVRVVVAGLKGKDASMLLSRMPWILYCEQTPNPSSQDLVPLVEQLLPLLETADIRKDRATETIEVLLRIPVPRGELGYAPDAIKRAVLDWLKKNRPAGEEKP